MNEVWYQNNSRKNLGYDFIKQHLYYSEYMVAVKLVYTQDENELQGTTIEKD